MARVFFLFSFIAIYSCSSAQQPADTFWHLANYNKKANSGIGWEKALKLLEGKPSHQTVVAVLDAGVDIYHPDFKNRIWTNKGEIQNNNIDDDSNGYVDDYYGWNFIGDVTFDNLEITREYVRLNKLYELKDLSTVDDLSEYQYYQKVKKELLAKVTESKVMFDYFNEVALGIDALETRYTTKINQQLLEKSRSKSRNEEIARITILNYYSENPELSYSEIKDELNEVYQHYDFLSNYGYNVYFNSRAELVGDHYENQNEQFYGNNKVYYGERFSSHGTHVAGIIASNSQNNYGSKGICQSCLIMSIRLVPEGDERDKDVANAIRYAVDNGAKVLNMSFGKSYSYNQEVIKDALVYAKSKGALFIHASGNDGQNNDEQPNYPNDFNGEFSDVWIEVGASSWTGTPNYIANFTNYGKVEVDVFAPGVAIYSTTPEKSYQSIDGTSMASPIVAGMAGLIWSYYPDFTAAEIKDIIIDSSIKIRKRQATPGTLFKKRACKISVTGSIVNLYEAMKLAQQRSQ
jgi:subtilisin family serine protease